MAVESCLGTLLRQSPLVLTTHLSTEIRRWIVVSFWPVAGNSKAKPPEGA